MRQFRENIFQRQQRRSPAHQSEKLIMKPSRTIRARSVTDSKRRVEPLGVARRVNRNQIESNCRVDCQNCAVIASRDRMGVSIRLGLIEEENVVRISNEILSAVSSTKHASTNKHDAMGGIRFLGSFAFNTSGATEIHCRNPVRLN